MRIWGEAELIERIWGAKEKYFQGTEEFSFMDLGRSMHYFQGLGESRPPPPLGGLVFIICLSYTISKTIRNSIFD